MVVQLRKINDYPHFVKIAIFSHENISPAFRAGDMFFIKYGEIRMWIEGPGGAFIDQFKNWSIL